MKKKSPFGGRKVACGVRSQRRSHHNHTGHPVETSGCGHATFGFRRAPAAATAWRWWRIWANKGFTNLAIVTKFSPLPGLCDNGKTTTAVLSTVRKVWMVRSTGARKLFKRIVRRRRDMQRLIPYRRRGTVARPASGHSCRPTSLWWQTRRSAFKSSLPVDPAVVSAADCNSAGRWDRARLPTRWSTSTLSAPGPAVAVFEIWYCACVKISPRVWGILGDGLCRER